LEPQYKGVGGWLLFLCIGLTILTPLVILGSLAKGYSVASQYFDRFPGLLAITVIDTILSLGIVAFSIYAGTGLWRIRPGAVRMAKGCLLCFLAYHVVIAILPFVAGLPSAANEAMIYPAVKHILKSVLSLAIWYSYLNKSKRVSVTYSS
jgi:hypothetical protein